MVAVYDYNPRELSPNVDVEVIQHSTNNTTTVTTTVPTAMS